VILLFEGVEQFSGIDRRSRANYWVVGICLLLQIYFLVANDHLQTRILLASVGLAFVTLRSANALFRRSSCPGYRLGYCFTALMFATNGILNLARGALTWVGAFRSDLFAPTVLNEVYFIGMLLTVVGWTFGFVILTHDRLVGELTAAEKRARDADAAKGNFVAHVSHELRTPLAAVIGLSDLILHGELTEEKRPEMETLQHSAKSLFSITNDLLDLAKIDAGRLWIVNSRFDLQAVLTNVARLFEPQAAAKGVGLLVQYPVDAPRWFCGDEQRIGQVISNLTSNAIKFTENGTVRIEVSIHGSKVRVSVHDTGIGISANSLALLFTRFVQADSTITRRLGGTGLGLSICKQLAELMGGEVGARSRPNEGSTFWIDLPLEPAETKETELAGSYKPDALRFTSPLRNPIM